MRIGNTVAMVRRARDEGYAVPAVNVFDEASMRGTVAAAEAAGAPLIVQVSVKTLRTVGCDLLTAMFAQITRDGTTPVALHLDHCPDRAVIDEVVAAGWSSVLFDASDRDLAAAEWETAEVVEQAHAAGLGVESEIENIIGVEDGVGSDVAVHAYTARQLAEVAERTRADLIAPQLGTSHGAYSSRPQLLPERVEEIRAFTDKPVVLHGGTGLSGDDFRAFIRAGVAKINISTAVKMAHMKAMRTHLEAAARSDHWDPPALFRAAAEAVEREVARHIALFGAGGRVARDTDARAL